MSRNLEDSHLLKRLISGATAGVIVGVMLGIAIAIRIVQMNSSLHTLSLKAQLWLNLGIMYALLMLVPGIIVGALILGRRRDMGLIAHGVIVLLSLMVFYYGRNKLSIHLFSRAGDLRWLAEIFGFLIWAVICWGVYRVLLWAEIHFKGWTVKISSTLAVALLVWSVLAAVRVPPVREPVPPPILPTPNLFSVS